MSIPSRLAGRDTRITRDHRAHDHRAHDDRAHDDRARDVLIDLLGVRLFVALWGSLLVIGVARPAGVPDVLTVVAVAALVAAASVGLRAVPALLLGVVAWLCILGFVTNDGGRLTAPDGADLARLGGLALAALLGSGAHRGLVAILSPTRHVGPAARRTLTAPPRDRRPAATSTGDR